MSLSKEFQDIVDACVEARKDGEWTPDEIHGVAREVVEAAGQVLAANSSDQSKADLTDAIETAIIHVARVAIPARFGARRAVMFFSDSIAEQVVGQLADYTGSVDDFVRDRIRPFLVRWHETLGAAVEATA